MGSFRQVTVTYPARDFVQVVSKLAQAGPVFLYNTDPTQTIFLTDDSTGNPATVDCVPVGPLSGYGLDGNTDTYAFMLTPGTQAIVSLLPGGTTFFQPASLSAIGGISVFIQASAPTQPPVIPIGSIWLQETGGTVIGFYTWGGSSWVQQNFNATDLLTAGTIVANLIAAGTVVAGIIDGTTVVSASYFEYVGGVEAAGELAASITLGAGTDGAGNAYLQGITVYQQGSPSTAIQFNIGAGVPAITFLQAPSFAGPWAIVGDMTCDLASGLNISATGGITQEATTITGGDLTFQSGRTANINGVRTIGVDSSQPPNTQTVNNTVFNAVPGLAVGIPGPGNYRFHARVMLQPAASAGQWETQIQGNVSDTNINYGFRWTSAAGLSGLNVNRNAWNITLAGPTPSVAGAYWAEYEGTFTASAAGTLEILAATTVAADTFNIFTGSGIYLETT